MTPSCATSICPRERDREIVHDPRDREYTLRGSETRTLATVGAFRVVSARDLRDHLDRAADPRQAIFDISANKADRNRPVGRPSRRRVCVLRSGRDLLERTSRPRPGPASGVLRGPQTRARARTRLPDLRRTCVKPTAAERERAHRRVVLDYELKREYQQWLHERDGTATTTMATRIGRLRDRAMGAEHDLPYFDEQVHFPDLRIEYAEIDGRWDHEDVEVTTVHYRGAHGAAAARSGFSCYRGLECSPRSRGGGRRRSVAGSLGDLAARREAEALAGPFLDDAEEGL